MKLSVDTLRELVRNEVSEKLMNDGCAGQVWHDEFGRWTSPKNATSWSRLDPDCEEDGQYKVIGGKKSRSNSPCGTQNRSKLCKEEEDDTQQTYEREKIEYLIRTTIRQELAKMKKSTGSCTYQNILNAMNQMDKARDGKLYDKKKS